MVAASAADYKDLIVNLLRDDAMRDGLRANIRAYVEKQAGWSKIALEHTKVYHSVVTTPSGKARYVYFPEPGNDATECNSP